MLKRVLTRWYFRKNLFVKLLAGDNKKRLSSHQKVWAYYRLGMYNKVLQTEGDLNDWRILLAKIIANAEFLLISCAIVGPTF